MGQCAFVVVFAGPRYQDDAGLVEVHGQADASHGILKFWPEPVCLGLVLETEEHVISIQDGILALVWTLRQAALLPSLAPGVEKALQGVVEDAGEQFRADGATLRYATLLVEDMGPVWPIEQKVGVLDEVEQGLGFSRIRFLTEPGQEALDGRMRQGVKGSLDINLDDAWVCRFVCRVYPQFIEGP